jgi:MoaA/NifB/PqqE/SkfB family radical SAM enzyme
MNAPTKMSIYELASKGSGVERLLPVYEHLVPPLFPEKFPAAFQLAPSDWHLPSEVVHRPEAPLRGALIRPLGTLDVEFISDELLREARARRLNLSKHYPCGMKCPGCFSEDRTYTNPANFLSWREVFKVIDDARTIGLRSIKFLGPGELFQNPDLFEILDAAENRDLPISIFTKGAELGDDNLAAYIHGHRGIKTAEELVDRLRQYSCVRILLGFNSFDPYRQDLMVGSRGVIGQYKVENQAFTKRGVQRYTEKRNRALSNLVAAGFNHPDLGQRLSLIAAPVDLDQIDEIPRMYLWAARRNIPLVIAPTMESGPKAIGLMSYNKKIDPAHERLIALYVAVYSQAISVGLADIGSLQKEGISAYMGTAPCNQVANGLYLRLNGEVQKCPGVSDSYSKFGNVHAESIITIWQQSTNYRDRGRENNWCRAKTGGMPHWLQDEVLSRLIQQKH